MNNNEETIIMQPQNENKAQKSQNVESPKDEKKKSGKGKKVAAVAGAAMFGSIAGGAGTAAAASMMDNAEEDSQEVEAQVDETSAHNAEDAQEVTASVDENGELDYTNNGGADPVVQPTGGTDSDPDEVQVLGIYEAEGEDGQTLEAAVITDGEEVAAVIDADGDGYADALVYDGNHNQQIDEGEVYDLSQGHVDMQQYEDAYIAQQDGIQQDDYDILAANCENEQDYDDYDNDCDDYDNDCDDYDDDASDLSFA